MGAYCWEALPPNTSSPYLQVGQSPFVHLDAFVEKVLWTLFLVQKRPGKRPFRAKARPHLQSKRTESPFSRNCVQAGDGGGVT